MSSRPLRSGVRCIGPKLVQVPLYKCDHCNHAKWKTADGCAKHERTCPRRKVDPLTALGDSQLLSHQLREPPRNTTATARTAVRTWCATNKAYQSECDEEPNGLKVIWRQQTTVHEGCLAKATLLRIFDGQTRAEHAMRCEAIDAEIRRHQGRLSSCQLGALQATPLFLLQHWAEKKASSSTRSSPPGAGLLHDRAGC